jgi:hypothetical protein
MRPRSAGPSVLPALSTAFAVFEQGKLSPERSEDRLTRLQARLDDLHAQQAELTLAAPHAANDGPTAADVAAVADMLEQVLAEADPQRMPKRSCGLLIDELRVNSRAEILPTYRLVTPAVCAVSEKVELGGLEPPTSWVRSRRSPN